MTWQSRKHKLTLKFLCDQNYAPLLPKHPQPITFCCQDIHGTFWTRYPKTGRILIHATSQSLSLQPGEKVAKSTIYVSTKPRYQLDQRPSEFYIVWN